MILLKDRLSIEVNGVKIQQLIGALVVWGRSFNSGGRPLARHYCISKVIFGMLCKRILFFP